MGLEPVGLAPVLAPVLGREPLPLSPPQLLAGKGSATWTS